MFITLYLKKYLKTTNHRYLSLIFLLIIFNISEKTYAQKPNDAEIKTALIYNFLKYIESERLSGKDTINIGYYGEDPISVNQLYNLKNEKVKGKRLQVFKYNNIKNIQNIDVLYVFNEYNFEITKIFKTIKETGTLLITDRYDDKREVMINFIHVEDKVQFEVNNKNISDAGFTISPKLLLFGGTELDVRELYRETEKTLKSERERTLQIEEQLNKSKDEVENLILILADLHRRNDSLNEVIKGQYSQIEQQIWELDSLQNDLLNLSDEVQHRKSELIITNNKLENKNNEIEHLDIQLEQKQYSIEEANENLDKLKHDIEEKEKILTAQQKRIDFQKIALYVFIAFFALFIAFIIYIYGNYKAHKRKNDELEKRNNQINQQKEHIQDQANELVKANRELEQEKNRAEDTLKRLKNAQSQLVAAEKMVSLGQLTSGIAHEINNPINYISSNIEGLRNILEDFKLLLNEYDQVLPPLENKKIRELKDELEYEELLSGFDDLTYNIKLGVDRTKEIVNSLRTFSRIDDDNFEMVDIHQNIDSAIILMGKHNKSRIKIIKEYGDIPKVECIPGKMSQVFMNILVNSVQAIEDEGEIKIKTEKTIKNGNHFILISVSDNGKGIKKEIKDKIFEPFFTTKDVGEGTGLGLSISYSIIKKHKGKIEVESEPDKGTTFNIYLPVN